MITTLLIDLDNTLLGSHKKRLALSFLYHYFRLTRLLGLRPTVAWKLIREIQKELLQGDAKRFSFERVISLVEASLTTKERRDKTSEHWLRSLSLSIFESVQSSFFPMPESAALISELEQEKKFKLILATNPAWPKEVVEFRMKLGKLNPHAFQLITTAENMHFTKPDVRYYEELLEILQVPAKNCLMIGDSLKKDGPAARIGIRTFLIKPIQNPPKGVESGTLEDLRKILGMRRKKE